jgi:HK97 family phage major capsid protein
VSPKIRPRPRVLPRSATRSSFAEYRAGRGQRLDELQVDDALRAISDGSLNPEYRAFWRYVTAPIPVTGDPLDGLDLVERRVLSKATNAAGGYIVPSDFDDQITSLRPSGSRIGALAREVITSTGTQLPVATVTAHGTSAWVAENASTTATDETFGQVTFSAFKAMTLTIVSEELLDDALPELDTYLASELAGRQVALEETAFAVGDGSGKPLGIAHSTSGYSVVTAATGSATGFKLADVVSAYAGLGDAYVPNASWLMSPSAFRSLAGLVDTAGGLVLPSLHSATPTLLGRPVTISPDLPATAANARSVVFGDISAAYTVRRVSGTGLQRIVETYSNNGQVGFRGFFRVDGRPVDLNAAIILRNSAT